MVQLKLLKKYGLNESTIRGIKRKYSETIAESTSFETVDDLPKQKLGRPFLLGAEMDARVPDFIRAQRNAGAIVTQCTVIAIGKAIIVAKKKFYWQNSVATST